MKGLATKASVADKKSAFPTCTTTVTNGMDLRDWFAGQILAAMASGGTGHFNSLAEGMAAQAYILADAAMRERLR